MVLCSELDPAETEKILDGQANSWPIFCSERKSHADFCAARTFVTKHPHLTAGCYADEQDDDTDLGVVRAGRV
ncbi:hypothetical protein GCM10008938_21160 [Deinococcus roseus]|uniref:Uncharacterized protein n=1 Tax=Deinococcus roseus TaxID=392414 RepID=A0ABQ2D194_9DEIO|nr:hypothetical protein GCM10008938_21160 [Deinococcus roseus]